MPPVPPPGRKILHVDMDAFYASVEVRDDPRLRGRPVAVGGSARRGVVLAASYEARPFGVRSAIPMARALRLCPGLVVVPPHFDRYALASEQVFAVFHEFTPEVEGLSLDEAFLDVTRSIALFGSAEEQAARIKARIRERVGLTASVGIAEVKFAAKVASDLRKPDGLVVVPEGRVPAFLAPLPVSRLWGVGPKTEKTVLALGLRTIGDVAKADDAWLERELGSLGPWLAALARGIDPRPVEADREAKSIGAEETFEEDLEGEDLHPFLHGQALRVAARLRRAGVRARACDFSSRTSLLVHPRRFARFLATLATGISNLSCRANLILSPFQAVKQDEHHVPVICSAQVQASIKFRDAEQTVSFMIAAHNRISSVRSAAGRCPCARSSGKITRYLPRSAERSL